MLYLLVLIFVPNRKWLVVNRLTQQNLDLKKINPSRHHRPAPPRLPPLLCPSALPPPSAMPLALLHASSSVFRLATAAAPPRLASSNPKTNKISSKQREQRDRERSNHGVGGGMASVPPLYVSSFSSSLLSHSLRQIQSSSTRSLKVKAVELVSC